MLHHDRRRLRIAQVAPLYESVPPKLYGGTERVVAYLTEELIRRGHEVTLFAAGDSTATATIEATHPKSLRAIGLVPWGTVCICQCLARCSITRSVSMSSIATWTTGVSRSPVW